MAPVVLPYYWLLPLYTVSATLPDYILVAYCCLVHILTTGCGYTTILLSGTHTHHWLWLYYHTAVWYTYSPLVLAILPYCCLVHILTTGSILLSGTHTHHWLWLYYHTAVWYTYSPLVVALSFLANTLSSFAVLLGEGRREEAGEETGEGEAGERGGRGLPARWT